MNKALFRRILPHLLAIILFLVIAVIYCQPTLDGKVLQQSDITGWKGSVQQSIKYGETHDGKYPLWTNSLFGGMPTFQIAFNSNNFIPGVVHSIMTLGLPAPIQFFFLACLSFYILSIILRVNPYVGIVGALGFAYATYNPVIISVGHATKMWTMAYMPVLLGSLILIYEKRYWLGAAMTALFSSVIIAMNHPQIAYYFFIAVGIMTIFYVIEWVNNKDFKHLAKALAFTAVAAIIGVMTNAVNVMSTYEYQKETIRGGSGQLIDTSANAKNEGSTDGLDRPYAFAYSMGIPEPFTMLVPRMYGGSGDKEEVTQEKSKAIAALQQIGQENLNGIAQYTGVNLTQHLRYYWGGIRDIRGLTYTSGPAYVGAIICFLAILSFFVIDRKHKWWALTAIIFTIFMSWGYYFKGFNYFLFDNFPLYNKFRAPSMVLVIPQLLLPMLAVLGLNAFITAKDKRSLMPAFKKGLIATGIVFVILFMLYMSLSYWSQEDQDAMKVLKDANQPQVYDLARNFFNGLKSDRQGLFMGDIWRSLGFIALAAAALFLLIRNTIKPILATAIIATFSFIDLIAIDSKYLNKENYKDELETEVSFVQSPVDKTVLTDTSFYRVMNLGGDAFSENTTSYNFNSVGGYHPAKLRIYQDLIERRISPEQNLVVQALRANPDTNIQYINTPTLNMLNVKYFLFKDNDEVTRFHWRNWNALGNAWFVQKIQYVPDAESEMRAIDSFDPKTTAIVQNAYKPYIPFEPQADSSAIIHLVKNDNDVITYQSSSKVNSFAVFSEVYYKSGWKAFIDGKETPIVKTNYALRGLAVPAGNHSIEFRFEPKGYYNGRKLTTIFSILLIAIVVGGAFMEYRERKKRPVT